MTKKAHWTTTPEGKARMAISMKKMWAAKRANGTSKRKHKKTTKKVVEKTVEELSITVSGPDTYKAVFQLLVGKHNIKVEINDDGYNSNT